MSMHRNPTRAVRVGTVTVGGGHPVAVQSMCATRTQDVDATVEQAEAIRKAGGDVVRVAGRTGQDLGGGGGDAPRTHAHPARELAGDPRPRPQASPPPRPEP